MIHNDFDYRELIKFGWEKTRENLWFLVCIAFIYLVITSITVNNHIGMFVSMVLTIAAIALSLHVTSGHTPTYRDILKPFQTYHVAVHYFIATLLYAVAVIIGLIFVLLPGIYYAVQLQFYSYIIVEHKDISPMEALKKSLEITKGHFWKIFAFSLIALVANILGALAFGIGLLITLPVTALSYARLYRKLADHHAGLTKTI